MKKSAKTGRAIRPQRSPVLPIRVPKPVYDALKKEAKTAGMTLSEFVNRLIDRGREWHETIGDARKLLQQANAEAKRIVDSSIEAVHRRHNWKRNEKGWWAPPEVHGLPADGFVEGEPSELVAEPRLDPLIAAEIKRAVQAALKDRKAR
jgi:hypothetical protein